MADQWNKHLAEKGYTGIALPSPEFGLLTLVYERHGARGHQNAFEQLAPGVAQKLPQPERNINLPTIAGERTRSVELGFGLKILSGLISALGGGTLGLELGFKNARKLSFAYDGVSSESLNAVALQQALSGVAAPGPGLLRDWLDDNLYVITSVLRARKVTITGHSETGQNAKLDVPVISGAVGGSLSVKTAASDDSTVSFEGAAGVPFAARLFQIVESGGGQKTLTLRTVREGSVTIKGRHEDARLGSTGEERDADRAPSILAWEPEREIEPAGRETIPA